MISSHLSYTIEISIGDERDGETKGMWRNKDLKFLKFEKPTYQTINPHIDKAQKDHKQIKLKKTTLKNHNQIAIN